MASSRAEYGSDYIVELLRELQIPYACFNPGATFRGLHESLINFGSDGPEIIEVCHEEISIDVAHGYARATGRPMAAITHDVVGLQHASMAIYNAWVDRSPVLVLGATGPADSTRRRPALIEWAHTALVQGSQVRDYVKFDDQPASLAAVPESLFNAYRLMMAEPRGPVYVCFDASIQEDPAPPDLNIPDSSRYIRNTRLQADPMALGQLVDWLVEAERPVLYAGWLGRTPEACAALVELAEALGAPVISSDNRFNLPSRHPLNLTGLESELLAEADLILALDGWDLAQALIFTDRASGERRSRAAGARVVQISLRDLIVRSWAQDYMALYPTELFITADTALAVPELVRLVRSRLAEKPDSEAAIRTRQDWLEVRRSELHQSWKAQADGLRGECPISPALIAQEVGRAIEGEDWVLAHNSHNPWPLRLWNFDQPHRYLTGHMGGGIGFGLGMSIGAALANRGTGRIIIDLQPDGDLLYSTSALWTVAHYQLPILIVMYNNRSFYNSQNHVTEVARHRKRGTDRTGIGSTLGEPGVDFAQVARGFGIWAEGPVESPDQLGEAISRAVQVVKGGRPALVDVVTQPR